MKTLKQHITEGRPSQRHPLEGHEYHKKTDAQLEYIAKDAHKAAEAMKGHNTNAENKYRDQANDSATVRYWRKKNGMPDWYKKKYGHIKEEVVTEISNDTLKSYQQKVSADAMKHKMDPTKRSPQKASRSVSGFTKAHDRLEKRLAEGIFDPITDRRKPLPAHGSTIKVAGHDVEISHVGGVGKTKEERKPTHIGYSWKKKNGMKSYEETPMNQHPHLHSLKKEIAFEIKGNARNEEVEQVDEAKLVGILRHPEHGKAYIWHKGGEGGYNYEVEHSKSGKKETHSKSHEDVVADLKKRGYKMQEEVKMNEQTDDEHFSKQSQKMKDAINLHLRKGKDYKGAVEAAKKHVKEEVNEDWQDVNRKDKTDGLSQAAVNAYRRENPGSKLQTAVTEKNPTGKRAKRRLSFCKRMGGLKKRLTSSKTANDPNSRVNKALRRWNC